MKRQLLLVLLILNSLSAFCQLKHEDVIKELNLLGEKVNILQTENSIRKSEIRMLSTKLNLAYDSIELLRQKVQENSNTISETTNELGVLIKETGDKNEGKITEVSRILSTNSLYGVIGVFLAILLSGFLYRLMSKRQETDKTDFIDKLSKTKSSIEESLVKEFGKQTELLDLQLHLIEQQKTTLQSTPNSEPDHSLALKVADEITLIERNISLMDATTKGLKQLSRSVEKIRDNLSANGYDIPSLLGKPFNQGMKIVPVSTIPDESLESGVEIITKVIKPQVNYNDKMIQAAQVEVSVGY
jgi:hypothetical protein